MNIWKKILNVLSSITKKDIIYTLIIVLLIGCLSSAVKQCSDTCFEYKNNIAALNDTIRYYQDKNGNLVATKLAFESDINTLKLLNKDLYNQIKDLKTKLKPNLIITQMAQKSTNKIIKIDKKISLKRL